MEHSIGKRIMAWGLTLLMIMSLVLSKPGFSTQVQAASGKYVKSLSVKKAVTVSVGSKVTVKPKVKVVKGASRKVKVKSKNKKIATVSYSAKTNKITIKGKKKGTTKITVTTVGKNKKGKKIKKTIKVTVTKKQSTTENTTQSTTENTTQSTTENTTQSTTENTTQSTTENTTDVPNEDDTTETTEILAQQVLLSDSDVKMYVGEKSVVSALVEPDTTTNPSLGWSVSPTGVVNITESGSSVQVEAVAEGKVTVTAATKDGSGKSASCTIEVSKVAVVSTQGQLDRALEAGVERIELNATDGASYEMRGSYPNTHFIVNGTGAKISNFATFASVTVNGGEYKEDAQGNNIVITAATDITVSKGAEIETLTVQIAEGSAEDKVKVINNGTIGALNITSAVSVEINGEPETTMITNISGEGAVLTTGLVMNIITTAKAELVLTNYTNTGGSMTTISSDRKENVPTIKGVGQYTVQLTDGSGDSVDVIAGAIDNVGKVSLNGKVLDGCDHYVDGEESYKPLENVNVYLVSADKWNTESVKLDEETATLSSTDETYVIPSAVTDSQGQYSIKSVPDGNYYLVMLKAGYMQLVQFMSLCNIHGTAYEMENVELLYEETVAGKVGEISGFVTDEIAPVRIDGLTVELRTDRNSTIGTPVATTTTANGGIFRFEDLTPGQYTLRIVDSRENSDTKYTTVVKNLCVKGANTYDIEITAKGTAIGNQLRFVLSWGSRLDGAPKDLDMYLYTPRISKEGLFKIYYDNPVYNIGNNVYAYMETDANEWNGPESIVVNQELEGNYYLYVHNYSGTPELSASGAKVDVYRGNELQATYQVPENDSENDYWKVCTYDAKAKEFMENSIMEESPQLEEDCFTQAEDLLESIYYTDDDDEDISLNYTIVGNNVSTSGNCVWSVLNSKVECEALDGYTATFKEKTAGEGTDAYRGTIVIKENDTDETVCTYNLFYNVDTWSFSYSVSCSDEDFTELDDSDRRCDLALVAAKSWNEVDKDAFTFDTSVEGCEVKVVWNDNTHGKVGTIQIVETATDVVLAEYGINYCNSNYQLASVESTDDELILECSLDLDDPFSTRIDILGTQTWDKVKDALEYTTVSDEVEAVLEDVSNEEYVAVINILLDEEVVYQYQVYYVNRPVMTYDEERLAEMGIMDIDMDDDWEIVIYYVSNSNERDASKLFDFKDADTGYTLEYDAEDMMLYVLLDGNVIYEYDINWCETGYIESIQGDDMVTVTDWDEYISQDKVVIYVDDQLDNIEEHITVSCVDGYTATLTVTECEEVSDEFVYTIEIKDKNGDIVETRDVYFEIGSLDDEDE